MSAIAIVCAVLCLVCTIFNAICISKIGKVFQSFFDIQDQLKALSSSSSPFLFTEIPGSK